MPEQTIHFTIPPQQQSLFEEEVKRSGFDTPAEFLRELVLDYLEMKRVEALIEEGLNDENYKPVTSKFFTDLRHQILTKGKIDVAKAAK